MYEPMSVHKLVFAFFGWFHKIPETLCFKHECDEGIARRGRTFYGNQCMAA